MTSALTTIVGIPLADLHLTYKLSGRVMLRFVWSLKHLQRPLKWGSGKDYEESEIPANENLALNTVGNSL